MRGDLSETTVADLCRGLSAAGATGAVELEDHGGDARIFFRAGAVYWAVSPTPRARLGDRLVNAGLLSPEQLEQVLEEQRTAHERTKLGALLVERGLVGGDAIRVFVQEQILDALFEMMGWHDGPFVFRPGEVADEKLPIDIPVDQLLVEVARRQSEWDRIQEAMPSLDMVPDFVQGGSSANAALEPDEFAVLASVDGQRSIRDLADDLGYSEFEAARIVYGLTLLGIIDVRDDTAADDDLARDAEPEAASDLEVELGGLRSDEAAGADDGTTGDEGTAHDDDIDVAAALEEALAAAAATRDEPDVVDRPRVKLHVDDDVSDYVSPREAASDTAPAAAPDDTPVRDEPEPWVATDGADEEAGTAADDDLAFLTDAPARRETPPTEPDDAVMDDDDLDALLSELAQDPGRPASTPPADAGPEEPAAEEPAAEEPPAEEPAAEEPAAEEPAAEEPPAEEPAAQEPPAEEPAAQEPPAEEPAAEEPPPAPAPPARRAPSGDGRDVSELLRELSQLAVDGSGDAAERRPPARPGGEGGGTRERRDADEAGKTAAASREEERRQAADKRDDRNKKRGLFGWGR